MCALHFSAAGTVLPQVPAGPRPQGREGCARGYASGPNARATVWRLMRNGAVKARIAELQEMVARQAEQEARAEAGWVVAELVKIARAVPRKFFHPDGTPRKVHELGDEEAAALSGFEPSGAAGKVVDRLKVPELLGAALRPVARRKPAAAPDTNLFEGMSTDDVRGVRDKVRRLLAGSGADPAGKPTTGWCAMRAGASSRPTIPTAGRCGGSSMRSTCSSLPPARCIASGCSWRPIGWARPRAWAATRSRCISPAHTRRGGRPALRSADQRPGRQARPTRRRATSCRPSCSAGSRARCEEALRRHGARAGGQHRRCLVARRVSRSR